MDKEDFLKALNRCGRTVRKCLSTESREWFRRACEGRYETDARSRLDCDRIYELLCAFTFVAALSKKEKIRAILGNSDKGYRFPYSPGNKAQFTFFRFEHKEKTYDVCLGTALHMKDQPPEHPDISLQFMGKKVDDLNRKEGKVRGIWDAKYHYGQQPKHDVQQMNWWCDVLKPPRCRKGDILRNALPKAFRVTAVITNADRPDKLNTIQLLAKGFSVVSSFTGDIEGLEPVPSRDEHIRSSPTAKSSSNTTKPRRTVRKFAAIGRRLLDV